MNPENTFAYLIAVENYTEDKALHPLPQSFTNVSELYKILKSQLIGLPKNNIGRSIDPLDSKSLIKDIKQLIVTPEAKTLIVYYAGHGVLDDDGNHYLTMTNSTVDSIEIDGLDIDDLSKAWGKKKNINVILILDSCFSENAFSEFKGRNYLLMASSAKNRTSKYPVDADYSAFTGELIKVMNQGVDIDSKTLSWKDIYGQVKTNLKEKGFPTPKISTQNEVEMIEACSNRFNTNEVSMEDRWIRVIKEEIGGQHPKFGEKVQGILNAGGTQVINKLMELLLNAFPFPIAYHLNSIFNKEAGADCYFRFYESVIRFLFIVDFIHFERCKQEKEFKPGSKLKSQFMDFSDPDHCFYFETLKLISEDLKTNKRHSFFKEFDFSKPGFQEAVLGIEKERKEQQPRLNVLKDYIFKLMPHISFFIKYRLLSVKEVNLSFRKYNPMAFNHSVSILQGNCQSKYQVWSHPNEAWQKVFIKNHEAKNSLSVLFFSCDENTSAKYLNLWPLIIDKNVLEPKATVPEIYLFSGSDNEDNFLYSKLGDSSTQNRKSISEVEALATDSRLETFQEILK